MNEPDTEGPDTGYDKGDLASFLNEYEMTAGQGAGVAVPPAKISEADRLFAQMQQGREADTAKIAELENSHKSVSEKLQALEGQQRLTIERSDFDKAVKLATDKLADFPHLPPSYAEDWLTLQAFRNPTLRNAFDNRHTNPQAFQKQMDRSLRALRDEVIKLPDPDITADQMAVVAALKGSSLTRAAPAAPKLGSLSNNEFNQYVKEHMGFNPGV